MGTRADPSPGRGRAARGTVAALVLVAAASGACGSGQSPTTSGQPATTAAPATSASSPSTVVSSSSPVPTSAFAFPTTTSVAFVAGDGTLTVTGDVQATGRFSSSSCAGLSVTEARGLLATFGYVSDPGTANARAYEFDLAGLSPGRTTLPAPGGFNQQPPVRIRLATGSGPPGDTLAWGTNAAGEGSVSGTVSTAAANGRSGTFDLQLGFVGTGNHGPVHVTGGWTCP